MLRYSDDATFNETVSQSSSLILDGLSLAGSGGLSALQQASKIRRAFALLDIASSTASITAITISDSD